MPQKKGQVKGQKSLTAFFAPKAKSPTSKPAKKVELEHEIGTAVKVVSMNCECVIYNSKQAQYCLTLCTKW